MSDLLERLAGLPPEKRDLVLKKLQEHGLVPTIDETPQRPPITPAPRDQPLPLSFAQQRLWFIDQWEPGNPFYNIPTPVYLSGPPHLPALAASLNGVVQRHESLRTTFAAHDGQPVQVITPSLTLPLPLIDLQALSPAAREAEAQRLVTQQALAPFDLSHGPLLRAPVLRLAPQEHVLLITMHHIVSDGWSTGIFIQEMAALYLAALLGEPSPLPELPIQYADFSLWQREWLQGDVLEQQLAFWQQQLGGAPTALDLPTDRPRPALQTFHGDTLSFTLPAPLTQALLAFSRKHNATPFMTLLAAFNVLLHRYTGQDDVLLGSPIANRHHRQTEGLIGFFVNTLVLRTRLSAAASFRTLLEQVRETTLQAYAYQDLPFEMLVEQLQPERDLSRTPLFQVMFALQNAPTLPMPGSGLSFAFLRTGSHIAKFDLTLVMAETSRGLSGTLVYNTDLFDEATIARLAQHWQTLLEGIAADPDRPLADLPLLTEAERGQVLLTWNDIGPAYPHDRCLHELFQAQVAHTPDALALFFQEHHLTYQALNRRANQLAHHLQALDAGRGTFVALCFERSLDMLTAILAVLKAGSAYLPLDPAYPQERLAFLLDDTQAPLLLTQRHLLDRLPAHDAQVLCLDADWPAIAQASHDDPRSSVSPDDLAYVIYTSGSTGLPKGVTISHAALCPLLHWGFHHLPLSPDDRSLQYLAYIFDWSVWEMFLPLTSGASLFLVTADLVLDPQATLDLMAEQHITVLHGTPTQFHYLTAPGQPLLSLRYACIGAEKLTFDLAQRTHDLLSPDCRLFNMYGPTEATIMAAVLELDRRNLEPLRRLSSVPIGPPIANNRCYVLDAHLHPQPTGVPGELYIAGGGLARSYLGRPALTAERFVPDPFHPQARAYRTGDLVKWLPDGALEFLGRIDYQVKLRGFRIELGEIEATLVAHPTVQQAVALVREDQPGDCYLAAYVLPQPGHTPDPVELRAFLQERLPDYMLPAAILALDALPQTPSGKIDRKALPTPDEAGLDRQRPAIPPRDALELRLAQIWQDVLDVRPVGVTHNFFELGGHSLLAVRVTSRIQRELGHALPLATFFQNATVEQLAVALRQRQPGAAVEQTPLLPIQPGQPGRRPLFFVHPAGGNVLCYADLARCLGPEQPFYGLQSPGLDGLQAAPSRLEAMAEDYVASLRQVQPQGPYLLGGWSLGGVVAFEMAQQLQAQGQQIALLALIDSLAPEDRPRPPLDDLSLLLNFALDLGLPLSRLNVEPETLARASSGEPLTHLLRQAREAGIVPPDLELSHIHHLFEVFKRNVQAMRSYVPRRYAGSLVLFKAQEPPTKQPLADDLGWGAWASGGIVVHEIAGNHHTLLRPPNVPSLAERLRSYLPTTETGPAP